YRALARLGLVGLYALFEEHMYLLNQHLAKASLAVFCLSVLIKKPAAMPHIIPIWRTKKNKFSRLNLFFLVRQMGIMWGMAAGLLIKTYKQKTASLALAKC